MKMLVVLFVALLSGCCTIVHGTHQNVGISSNPSGAKVVIDNKAMGYTPMVAKLKRRGAHTVSLELPGYEPFGATLTSSISGWVWGDIGFGGLIGLTVDAIDGAVDKLEPEAISATLLPPLSAATFKQ
jgi:uncharacterized protein YceK